MEVSDEVLSPEEKLLRVIQGESFTKPAVVVPKVVAAVVPVAAAVPEPVVIAQPVPAAVPIIPVAAVPPVAPVVVAPTPVVMQAPVVVPTPVVVPAAPIPAPVMMPVPAVMPPAPVPEATRVSVASPVIMPDPSPVVSEPVVVAAPLISVPVVPPVAVPEPVPVVQAEPQIVAQPPPAPAIPVPAPAMVTPLPVRKVPKMREPASPTVPPRKPMPKPQLAMPRQAEPPKAQPVVEPVQEVKAVPVPVMVNAEPTGHKEVTQAIKEKPKLKVAKADVEDMQAAIKSEAQAAAAKNRPVSREVRPPVIVEKKRPPQKFVIRRINLGLAAAMLLLLGLSVVEIMAKMRSDEAMRAPTVLVQGPVEQPSGGSQAFQLPPLEMVVQGLSDRPIVATGGQRSKEPVVVQGSAPESPSAAGDWTKSVTDTLKLMGFSGGTDNQEAIMVEGKDKDTKMHFVKAGEKLMIQGNEITIESVRNDEVVLSNGKRKITIR